MCKCGAKSRVVLVSSIAHALHSLTNRWYRALVIVDSINYNQIEIITLNSRTLKFKLGKIMCFFYINKVRRMRISTFHNYEIA